MDKVTRRKAVALGIGASATPAWTLPVGGEVDTTTQGVNVKLIWLNGGWEVLVPDIESVQGNHYWHPGMMIPWKTVKLDAYLSSLEDYFNLRPKA